MARRYEKHVVETISNRPVRADCGNGDQRAFEVVIPRDVVLDDVGDLVGRKTAGVCLVVQDCGSYTMREEEAIMLYNAIGAALRRIDIVEDFLNPNFGKEPDDTVSAVGYITTSMSKSTPVIRRFHGDVPHFRVQDSDVEITIEEEVAATFRPATADGDDPL